MLLALEKIALAYRGMEPDFGLRRVRYAFSRQLAARCASREGFALKNLNETYNEFVLGGRNLKKREYFESGIWDGTLADYEILLCNVGLMRWYDLRECAGQWSGTAMAIEFDLPLHHLDGPTHRRRGRFLETAERCDPKPATAAIVELYGVVPHLSSNCALSAGSLWWRGERAEIVLSRVRRRRRDDHGLLKLTLSAVGTSPRLPSDKCCETLRAGLPHEAKVDRPRRRGQRGANQKATTSLSGYSPLLNDEMDPMPCGHRRLFPENITNGRPGCEDPSPMGFLPNG